MLGCGLALGHVACAQSASPAVRASRAPEVESGRDEIAIDLRAAVGAPMESLTGFVQGFPAGAPPPRALTSPLRPRFWRMAGSPGAVLSARQLGDATVTWILSDPIESGALPRPWTDWPALERYVQGAVATNVAQGRPVTYWDLYNEPELNHLAASEAQMLEIYRRENIAVRAADPEAKIVAPSTSSFNERLISSYLRDTQAHGLTIDALSWHEINDAPERLGAHVTRARELLRAFGQCHTTGGQERCPELHVNEYSNAANHRIAGWAVGWLYHLHHARRLGLDWASRTCWTNADGVDDCLHGLDGLLTASGAPTPLYWVYRAQAQMSGGELLEARNSSPRLVALASRAPSGAVSLLVGRWSCGQTGQWCREGVVQQQLEDRPLAPVRVTIRLSPFERTAVVRMARIPARTEAVLSALARPEPLGTSTIEPEAGELTISIPAFEDGDAFEIIVEPRRDR